MTKDSIADYYGLTACDLNDDVFFVSNQEGVNGRKEALEVRKVLSAKKKYKYCRTVHLFRISIYYDDASEFQYEERDYIDDNGNKIDDDEALESSNSKNWH